MLNKIIDRKSLRERMRKNAPGKKKHLRVLLNQPETRITLDDILQSLEDVSQKSNYLEERMQLIVKFTDKARRTMKLETSEEKWLPKIDELIKEYENLGKKPPASLYLAKFNCLLSFLGLDNQAEICIQEALRQESDPYKQIDINLRLVFYYENLSLYQQMKRVLDECKKLCSQLSNAEKQLSQTWLLLGHYYFYQFNFKKSSYYLEMAREVLENLCQKQESPELLRLLSNCLHYSGRIHFARYEFTKAAQMYVRSEDIKLKVEEIFNLEPDIGATAFYHLRLAQVLEASRLLKSAKHHYDRSLLLFEKCGSISGIMQVNLSLANLIGSDLDDENYDRYTAFKKQENQIKEALSEAQTIGYKRGYLESLIRLLFLYMKNYQFLLAIKTGLNILSSEELYQFLNPTSLIGRLKLALGVYGLGPYYRMMLSIKKHQPGTILNACPCPDPECPKLRTNQFQ